MSKLFVIFNDQLSVKSPIFDEIDEANDIILLSENEDDYSYVKHHKKKIVFQLSSMRHFHQELLDKGYTVIYQYLDQKISDYLMGIHQVMKKSEIDAIVVIEPNDYRLTQEIKKWNTELEVPVHQLTDNRYLCGKKEFHAWAKDKKNLRMENFYQNMRYFSF